MNGELKTARVALEMGADGLVMSHTNVDPMGCLELIRAVRSANRNRAEELQSRFLDVWGLFPTRCEFHRKGQVDTCSQGTLLKRVLRSQCPHDPGDTEDFRPMTSRSLEKTSRGNVPPMCPVPKFFTIRRTWITFPSSFRTAPRWRPGSSCSDR